MIVAVQNGEYILKFKPESQVLYSTEERVEILEALKVVDEVYVYDTVSVETLTKIEFDVLALGEDQIGQRFDEIVAWYKKQDKEVVRLKQTQGISSKDIKSKASILW